MGYRSALQADPDDSSGEVAGLPRRLRPRNDLEFQGADMTAARAYRAERGGLAFLPDVRRVIYTTNLIESMNARLRKVTRNRGQSPSGKAALKVLCLAVRNLEEFRSPEHRDPQLRVGSSPAAIHDLLRRPGTNPMKPATITYTDDRTGPSICHSD